MSATFGGAANKEIHSGALTKMGGNIKSWRKRWMILRSNHTLQYFKEPGKVALGTITLNDINFDVASGNKDSCHWPKNCNVDNSLVLTTSNRTYYMFADSEVEAEEWLRHLQTYADEASKARGTRSTLPNRYNKIGGVAQNLATPTAVDSSHMPKMYKKKDRRLPTKRFNKVDDHDDDDGGDGDGDDDLSEDDLLDSHDGGTIDGELDRHQFEPTSDLSLSISTPVNPNNKSNDGGDGIYMLASSTDDKHPPPPRVTSPNSNNNNGRGSSSHSTSLVDIHESLYDLVGRINAGDDCQQQDTPVKYDMVHQTPEEHDLYEEPMSDPGPSPFHPPAVSPTHSAKSLPVFKPSPSPSIVSKTSLGVLPSIPTCAVNEQPTCNIYEPVDEKPSRKKPEIALYDEISPQQKDGLVHPSDSSDNESPPPPPIPKPRSNTKCNESDLSVLPAVKVSSRSPSPLPPPLPPPLASEPNDDDDEYYGNAPTLPPKPNSSPSAPQSVESSPEKTNKKPVPVPRNGEPKRLSTFQIISSSVDAYDDCVPIIRQPENNEAIYDDTVTMVTNINPSKVNSTMVLKEPEVADANIEGILTPSSDGQPDLVAFGEETKLPEVNIISNGVSLSSNEEDAEVVYRTSPKKQPQRVHSATTGSYDQGIAMFHKRAQHMSTSIEEDKAVSGNVRQLLLADKEALDKIEKTTVAETLREIEMEKHLASEERFKWERERLKLEEERRQFEEEKRRFQEEMRKMQLES